MRERVSIVLTENQYSIAAFGLMERVCGSVFFISLRICLKSLADLQSIADATPPTFQPHQAALGSGYARPAARGGDHDGRCSDRKGAEAAFERCADDLQSVESVLADGGYTGE